MTRKLFHSLRILLSTLTLVGLMGCGGNAPTVTPTPPANPTPPPTRTGEVVMDGALTIMGSTSVSPTYERNPAILSFNGKAGTLALLQFTPTAIPAANVSYYVKVTDQTTTLNTYAGNTSTGRLYLPTLIAANGPVTVSIYNSATVGGALNPQALNVTGNLTTVPKLESPKDDDNNPVTTSDKTLAPTTATHMVPGTVYRVSDSDQDIEDWYYNPQALYGGTIYFQAPENWGQWTYTIRAIGGEYGGPFDVTDNDWHEFHILGIYMGGPLYFQVKATSTGLTGTSVAYGSYRICSDHYGAVATPTILSVAPQGFVGVPGDQVQFTMVTDQPDGAVTNTTWPFASDGSGSVLLSGTNELTAQVKLGKPGHYTLNVTAKDSVGTGTKLVDYWIGTVPASANPAPITDTGTFGQDSSWAIDASGNPLLAYTDSTNKDVYFARATVPNPSGPADWSIHQVAGQSGRDVGRYLQLALYGTFPVLGYYNDTFNTFNISRAKVAQPLSAADWATMGIDATGTGKGLAIDGSGSVIRVAYQGAGTDLKYATANLTTPSLKTDWTLSTLDASAGLSCMPVIGPHNGTAGNALVYYFGNPLATSEIRYAVGAPAFATRHTIFSIGARGASPEQYGRISLGVPSTKKPYVGCYDPDLQSYVIAESSATNPTTPANWTVYGLESNAVGGMQAILPGAQTITLRDLTTGDIHVLNPMVAAPTEPISQWRRFTVTGNRNEGLPSAWGVPDAVGYNRLRVVTLDTRPGLSTTTILGSSWSLP